MDLGLSAKAQAWIRVATLTLGSFMAAYQGVSADQWVSSTEWISLLGTTVMTFLASVSGAPKDARDKDAQTRQGD